MQEVRAGLVLGGKNGNGSRSSLDKRLDDEIPGGRQCVIGKECPTRCGAEDFKRGAGERGGETHDIAAHRDALSCDHASAAVGTARKKTVDGLEGGAVGKGVEVDGGAVDKEGTGGAQRVLGMEGYDRMLSP